MICSHAYKRSQLILQSGIGLVELLVSLLIGLFVMGGVLQLFSTSSQNAVAVTGSSRIQENVRFAFSRIADDITQSGNLGCISSSVAQAAYSSNTPIVSEVDTLAGSAYNFLSPIRVANATENGTGAAPTDGRAPGTDEFGIGYVNNAVRLDVTDISATSVSVNDARSINVGDIVAVSNCFQGAIFAVSGVDTTSDTVSHVATFDKNISSFIPNNPTSAVNVVSPFYLYGGTTGAYEYSIGKSAAAAATDECIRGTAPQATAILEQANCALFRTDTSAGPAARQELVQGVHNLQVEYGWTDSDGNLRFADAPNVNELPLVDRVRVTMMFNSIDNVNTVVNSIDQTADGLILKTYSRTFNLFNRLQ